MAKKFKFRLESVLKYRKIIEDEKKREFAEANKAVELQRSKISELESERVEIIDSIRDMRSGNKEEKIHLSSMVDAMLVVGGIEMGIISANNEVKRLQKEVEGRRLAFVESQKDKKAIETLRDKRKKIYLKEVDSERQKQLDELSIRMSRNHMEEEEREAAFRKFKNIEINRHGEK